ncbi:MAG: replication initiation factor domain-containing protein [Bacillota bacterium]|nr:replication initiation factor domain-containing protein [Bacillota bacterium]
MNGFEVEYKVSLDNLTIVGTPKYKGSQIRALLISKGFVNQHWMTPYKRYHDNYTLLGGGLLQVTHDTGFVDKNSGLVNQIRLEFNPNKIHDHSKLLPEYLDILKLIEEPKITRKDIAIDLMGIDINDFMVIDYAGRKRIEYKSSNMKLETLYFGSKFSDVRHRIYNKTLEQGLDSGIKWWRVEAQIRKEKAEMTKYNSFSKVKIVSKQDFLHHDVRTRAMLFYLQANPDAMQELSVNARTKYKKLLGEQIEYWYIDIEGMAEESIKDIQSEIESWLDYCPIEASQGFKLKILPSCLTLDDEKLTDEQKKDMLDKFEKWEEISLKDIVSRGTKEDFEKWVESVFKDCDNE